MASGPLKRRVDTYLLVRVRPRISGSRCLPALLVLTALSGCQEAAIPADLRVLGGDPEIGRSVIAAVECGVCHEIPGIAGADGIVGPPLADFGRRQFIAGVVPNRPDLLARWVREAPSIVPETGMPDMPITEEQARHVAAYLYTLR